MQVETVHWRGEILPSPLTVLRSCMQPLHALLNQSLPSKSQALVWNNTALAAFYATKDALANTNLLVHPRADVPTCLITDASDSWSSFAAVCQWNLASDLFLFKEDDSYADKV